MPANRRTVGTPEFPRPGGLGHTARRHPPRIGLHSRCGCRQAKQPQGDVLDGRRYSPAGQGHHVL